MAYGYSESFVGGQPPVQVHRVGGWKLLLGVMVAAVLTGPAWAAWLKARRPATYDAIE